jgi:beta-mannosidase
VFVEGLREAKGKLTITIGARVSASSPSPDTPGEGGGEGSEQPNSLRQSTTRPASPHLNPLPYYREREKLEKPADVVIKPGVHAYDITLPIENPALWWPAEHGPQNLYAVRVSLAVEGQPTVERDVRVGFRQVRIIQDPHPKEGRYFLLEVNGRKIFAKGANWAPADMILARCDRERYENLLALAREAHFNFFRINGCGLWENDEFYDVCDELGLMVWQDAPFTNSHYPFGNADFLAECEREASHNVRRIAQHPSLIVWCGNNEMAWLGGNEKPAEPISTT